MFEVFRSPSRSAAGAIGYITVGALTVIWSGLWYYYFLRPVENPPAWQSYVCMATIFSGVAVMVIGLLFGLIGRGAKAADNVVGGVESAHMVATPVVSAPVVSTSGRLDQLTARIGSARVIEPPVSVRQ